MSKAMQSIGGGVALAAMLGSVFACGFSPPEECAVPSGSADETAFAQHFTQIAVVAKGGAASSPVEEVVFSPTDTLEVVAVSLADTATNLCLQERKGGGKILYNETPTLHQGEDRVRLGSFAEGDYVIRVIVDKVLVRNLAFSAR